MVWLKLLSDKIHKNLLSFVVTNASSSELAFLT